MNTLETSSIIDLLLMVGALLILYLIFLCLYYFGFKPIYRGVLSGGRRLIGILYHPGIGQKEFDYEIEEEEDKKRKKVQILFAAFAILIVIIAIALEFILQ